jgi:hypothetical protein
VKKVVRFLITAAVGVVTFLGTMGATCDDIGGVPTWERCDTWLGTPAFVDWPSGILDLIIPLAPGTTLGLAAWWLLGLTPLNASTQPATTATAERTRSPDPE